MVGTVVSSSLELRLGTGETHIMGEELADFGFPESLCAAAMQQSFLTSTEERVEWILSNIDTGDELERSTLQQQQDDDEEFKMVILIRSDLAMSPGKVASQCVHAALGCVRQFTSPTKHSKPNCKHGSQLAKRWSVFVVIHLLRCKLV